MRSRYRAAGQSAPWLEPRAAPGNHAAPTVVSRRTPGGSWQADGTARRHPFPSEREVAQDAGHPPSRAAPMRDRVLLSGAVLPERAAARTLPRRLEQRVVAEAAPAPRLERDSSARRPTAGPDVQA